MALPIPSGKRTVFMLFLLFLWANSACAEMNNDDVMGCAICSFVVEAMMIGRTPAKALALAYQRCSRMGLMEPICDQMIERNVKQLLEIANNASTTKAICAQFCEI